MRYCSCFYHSTGRTVQYTAVIVSKFIVYSIPEPYKTPPASQMPSTTLPSSYQLHLTPHF